MPRGGPLIPVHVELGLKGGTFSPHPLVSVSKTGTKGPYEPVLKVIFLLVRRSFNTTLMESCTEAATSNMGRRE